MMYLNLSILTSVCLVLCRCINFQGDINLLDKMLIASIEIQQHFNSGCMFVIVSDDYLEYGNDSILIQYLTRLFRKNQIAVITIENILHEGFFEAINCRKNKPLFVILCENERFKSYIKKITEFKDISEVIWLIYLLHETTIEEFFTDINIPFDCEVLVAQSEDDHIVLTEVYRISSTLPLQTYNFGYWNLDKDFSWPRNSFYQRRNDLQGLVIKTGTIHDNPIQITKEINNKPMEVGGYFGKVWKVLEGALNFTSDYYKPLDYAYGARLPNDSWNGLIAMLLKDEITVTNADLYWTDSRAEVIDYIAPIICFRTTVFIKKINSVELEWTSYCMPFSTNLWIALTLTVVCMALTLYLTMKISKEYDEYLTDLNSSRAIIYVYGAFCLQGQTTTPAHTSGRIVLLIVHLMAVITSLSYSASLISSIMTRKHVLPFTDFEGFLKDGSYTLGAPASSAELDFFKNSADEVMQDIYNKHISNHESSLPRSIVEGLQNVCLKEKYAWMISPINALAYLKELDCEVEPVPNAFIPGCASMAVRKKSPHRAILRHISHKLHNYGILQIIYEKNFHQKIPESQNDFLSVNLNQVTPILVFLSVCMGISVLMLVIEKMLRKQPFRKYTQGK